MQDEHQDTPRTVLRWGLGLRRGLALLLLGLLAYGGGVAAQHAYARQLGLLVILFVVGATIVTSATWFYPRLTARVIMGLGAVLVGLSVAITFGVGLVWESIVGFCVLLAAEGIAISLSALWWPLRKLSSEDRRTVYRRLRKLPYRERRRLVWSRHYDQFLSKE